MSDRREPQLAENTRRNVGLRLETLLGALEVLLAEAVAPDARPAG